MSTDKLISPANKLKNYSVLVDSNEMPKESILEMEISYKNNTPIVYAKIMLDDLYDLSFHTTWRDSLVTITYLDFFENDYEKIFKIIDIAEKLDKESKKTFEIKLQDLFSYTLQNSYYSKSFKDTPLNALKQYTEEYEIEALEWLTYEYTNMEVEYEFTVPKHINNLDWFLREFNKFGYVFYQDKSGIKVKSPEDILPSNLPLNSPDKKYLTETDNQVYRNKIHDIRSSFNKRINIIPNTRSFAYEFDTKTILYNEDNTNSDWYLNDDTFNLQDTQGGKGTKYLYQQHLNFEQHTKTIKNSLTKQSEIEIVVNGYFENDLYQQYELFLKGNIGSADTQVKGNMIVNGLYESTKIIDKFIGDSLVQKITLIRTDMTKVA